MRIAFVRQIWKGPFHHAFPDLIYFQGRYFVSLRQAETHFSAKSKILILTSTDLVQWAQAAEMALPGHDLRDPKLSIVPDGRLMLNMGSLDINSKGALGSFVSFSKTGFTWTSPHSILETGMWLWRITWHQGKGYGVSYRFFDPLKKELEWIVDLHQTDDGVSFHKIASLNVKGHPNEATVRFDDEGSMWILIRRDKNWKSKAVLLRGRPPYREFHHLPLNSYLGGPNFLEVKGQWIVAGRFVSINPYGIFERMGISLLSHGKVGVPLFLPGTGDLGYPGMVWNEERLLVCYYASEENLSSIYLAGIEPV
ncbi:hypothetical protein [Estrella lausannensis]|nr:hypothetical protein [Estrella lausannensis]